MKLTKDLICKRLKIIAKMLDREYTLEGLKTTRAIYREVSQLHNDLKDEDEKWQTTGYIFVGVSYLNLSTVLLVVIFLEKK